MPIGTGLAGAARVAAHLVAEGRRRGRRRSAGPALGALGILAALVLALSPAPASLAAPTGTTWTWENPRPQGNTLNAVSCATAGACVAVGDAGTIVATTDGGGTWTVQSSGTANRLNGV